MRPRQAQRVEVGADVGATSAAAWLAHESRTTRPDAHRRARLEARLDDAHPEVDRALAEGAIVLEQAQVIVEAVDARPDDTVPRSGGLAATVVVTMTHESLIGGLQAAGLCDGTRISAGEARRLACGAGIVPVVLGGASEPLDVGRRRRFHTQPMRIAMGVRDGGCTAIGCDRPAAMCHAHHDQPWSRGGRTDLASGRLLCARHHTLAHDRRYLVTARPGGTVSFTRRT